MDSSTSTSTSTNHLANQLSQELQTRYYLSVSRFWLTDFLSTVRKPPPPLPALVSTANFRLLNSDFTKSLVTASSTITTVSSATNPFLLPHNITDVRTKYTQLRQNVPVQVLDVLDLGVSKYAQIEAIERVEQGEEVRGREVIRTVPVLNDEDNTSGGAGQGSSSTATTASGSGNTKKSAGPHKLLLQDAAGTRVWGFELVTVSRVFLTTTAAAATEVGGLQIGAKLLLKKGLDVRRGMLMLEPKSVTVLGGKVEEWDKEWREGRKQRLVDDLKRESEEEQQQEEEELEME